MKQYVNALFFSTVVMLVASCTKNDSFEKTQINIKSVLENTITKVSDSGFENSDQIGVYVVDYSGTTPGSLNPTTNHATNVSHKYAATSNIWTPETGKEIYWNNSVTKVDLYGYYPFDNTVKSISEYPFSVQADQTTSSNYYNSDFLWAKTSNVKAQTFPVTLTFVHRMSKIVITTSPGVGFTENEFNAATKNVQILGTKLSSKINLSNGIVSLDNSVENGIITTKANGNVFTAILVPQTISESNILFKVTINGVEYYYSKGVTFESNKQYNFTISINKNSLRVISNGVSEWSVDGNTYSAKEESIIKDIDGNVYSTVKIGTQTWMKENLKTTKYNDGTSIPNVTDFNSWINLTTPAYCWFNNSKILYGNTYGGLYNWYSVNTGNLCPTGWHIPSITEINTLVNYLGGSEVAGGKLKESGTSHWPSPNIASNESLFTAIPGGYRANSLVFNGFEAINYEGYWWTGSGSISSGYSQVLVLQHFHEKSWNQGNPIHYGHSVRCIKD